MIARPLVFLALATAFLTPAQSSHSEVIHGVVDLRPTWVFGWPEPMPWEDGFDFETQAIVPYKSASSDLSWEEDVRGGDSWFRPHNADGIQLGSESLVELQAAPLIEAGYFASRAVRIGTVYVMRTGDGHYVKFAVKIPEDPQCSCWLLVEYYVQTDGSPNFGPLLPVRPTTWGQVKALYR